MLQHHEQPGPIGSHPSLGLLRLRIEAYIEANLETSQLTVATIAQRMGCSPRYVHRAFETGSMTIAEYLWETRLHRAWARLISADGESETISDVAFSVGFASSAHFSRAFKGRFGVAPSALRRSARLPS